MSLIVAALLVGATVGTFEGLWVVARSHAAGPTVLASVVLYGSAVNGLAGALGGAVFSAFRARSAHVRSVAEALLDAVTVVATIFVSARFFVALARLREPRLAWLVPACVLSGIAAGVLLRWAFRHFLRRQMLRMWAGLNAGALALAVAATVWKSGTPPVACAAGFAVLIAVMCLLARRDSSMGRYVLLVGNIGLYLALIALAAGALRCAGSRGGTRTDDARPNIALISVDTLRRDRLGCYGYANARTPRIDALAAEGALFEDAVTPIPETGPAHTTMLTGLFPMRHGATRNGRPIGRGVRTVAEWLSRHGYHTAAVVSGWTLKDRAVGLGGRFARYDDDFSRSPIFPDPAFDLTLPRLAAGAWFFLTGTHAAPLERPGAQTTRRALAWLASRRDRPFFLFLHYFDPHAPYAPPPPYDAMHDPDYRGAIRKFYTMQPLSKWRRLLSNPRDLEHVKALYDGEISYADAQVGAFLDGLREMGLEDDTVVIFTADHGESLTEHQFYFDHAEFLYDASLRIPLIIRFPDRRYRGTRAAGQVRLTDITPTILDLAGVRPSGVAFDGQSLLPVLNGSEAPGRRAALGAIRAGHGDNARSRYYVRDRGFKLIWNFDRRERLGGGPALEELYDLGADPGEEKNLAASEPPILGELRRAMAPWQRAHVGARGPAPGPAVREQLRRLGY